MTVQTAARPARALLTDADFTGVAATVARNNPGMAAEVAERITTDAIKFVAAAAASPGRGLRPSRIVDEGWHALILHTRVYRALCADLGQFIDHVPEPPQAPAAYDPGALARTQYAIRQAGYEPDPMLWVAPWDGRIPVAAGCEHTGCSTPGTCTETCAPSGPN